MAKEVGFIKQIFPVESFQGRDGKQYQKRRVWIDNTYVDRLGQRSPNDSIIEVEFSGEKIGELNSCQIGQPVIVSYSLRGTTAQNKTSGEMMCFVKLHGFKIERYGQQQAQAPQPPQNVQQPPYQQPQNVQQQSPYGQQQGQSQSPYNPAPANNPPF